MCSIAVALMWFKLFYWMRLFTPTAFFMNLLAQTFQDILEFMIMLILIITTFTNMMYILNQKRILEGGARLYGDDLENEMMNAWLTQFRLGLGDFNTDGFKGENAWYLWGIFIVAVVVIQITFLNMLIAIMGNTFDKVIEKKQISSLKEKINILNDYRNVN